jgi:hypothetical protein
VSLLIRKLYNKQYNKILLIEIGKITVFSLIINYEISSRGCMSQSYAMIIENRK